MCNNAEISIKLRHVQDNFRRMLREPADKKYWFSFYLKNCRLFVFANNFFTKKCSLIFIYFLIINVSRSRDCP